MTNPIIKVIIPAYNEQDSIGLVIKDIPKNVDEVIVVSNASTDNTEKVALTAGATVLQESNRGYGYACLKGLSHIATSKTKPDIIGNMDGLDGWVQEWGKSHHPFLPFFLLTCK